MPLAPRLSEAEALRIAGEASGWGGRMRPLVVQGVAREDDRTVWIIRSATVGSGVSVTVDDGTGEARVTRWGVR